MARQFSVAAPVAQQTQERVKSQVWINVGVQIDDKFVSIPFGLAIDTMGELDMPKNVKSEEGVQYAQLVQARNALLKKLQSFGEQLEPGEDADLDGLKIVMHRVKEAVEYKPTSNSLLDGINSLF